jgi:hypothetical protein
MSFEREAVAEFDGFMRDLHRETMNAEGLEAGWLGKGPGTVARLSAILTLLAWSDIGSPMAPELVTQPIVRDAVTLWRGYFRPHATAVFNQAGNTDRDRDARRVIRWLRATRAREVGREQIRIEALSYSVDAEGADRVIARLEAGGILRLAAVARARHRPAKRWQVNPALR